VDQRRAGRRLHRCDRDNPRAPRLQRAGPLTMRRELPFPVMTVAGNAGEPGTSDVPTQGRTGIGKYALNQAAAWVDRKWCCPVKSGMIQTGAPTVLRGEGAKDVRARRRSAVGEVVSPDEPITPFTGRRNFRFREAAFFKRIDDCPARISCLAQRDRSQVVNSCRMGFNPHDMLGRVD
jgi:hypothetical protein